MSYRALFLITPPIIVKDERPKFLSADDEWEKEKQQLCTMEWYLAIERGGTLAYVTTWVELKVTEISLESQIEQGPCDLTHSIEH